MKFEVSRRHSRAGGKPVADGNNWVPACAGMTLQKVGWNKRSSGSLQGL